MIKEIFGSLSTQSTYSGTTDVLVVTVVVDAKKFKKLDRRGVNPLASIMPQIKNVVWDATRVQSMPSYTRASYKSAWPRASKGLIKLEIRFPLTKIQVESVGMSMNRITSIFEQTKSDGHLFAKPSLIGIFNH